MGSNEVPDDVCPAILGFLEYNLSTQKQQRNYYQELLELTNNLGRIPKNGITFHIPEAVSHASGCQKQLTHSKYTCLKINFSYLLGRGIYIFLAWVYV